LHDRKKLSGGLPAGRFHPLKNRFVNDAANVSFARLGGIHQACSGINRQIQYEFIVRREHSQIVADREHLVKI